MYQQEYCFLFFPNSCSCGIKILLVKSIKVDRKPIFISKKGKNETFIAHGGTV